MRKQKGFSLIELLIVVAIILIIAAIAIPNLLRSRIAANEASAVGSVRTINTAEVTYASTYPSAGFAETLEKLGPAQGTPPVANATAAGLIDSVLGCATMPCNKSGYAFTLAADTATLPAPTYTAVGNPQVAGQSGQRRFCSDASGVIRVNQTTDITGDGKACATTDSPLQ